jgi:CheY-like chemotaxis protein
VGTEVMAPGILFVDDEPENVIPIADVLREALALPVVVVPSVEEAVALLHDRPWITPSGCSVPGPVATRSTSSTWAG